MVLFTEDEVTEEEAFAAMVAQKEDNPSMTIEKPFGKAGFGKGKYEKSPYYLKPIPQVESPILQTVMPYEIGVNNSDILKILEQAVADSVFPGGVLLVAKQGKVFIHTGKNYMCFD